MTFRFVMNPLTHCATLLFGTFGKETIYKLHLILLLISIKSTSQYGGFPYHFKME